MTNDLCRIGGALSILLLGACTYDAAAPARVVAPLPAPALAAATEINTAPDAAARLKADVTYLADDAREGREAGTAGYQAGADYVAARMQAIGLKPAGNNGWFQKVPLVSSKPVLEASAFSITNAKGETMALTHLDDFLVFPAIDETEVDISGEVVFVGYGIHAPDQGHDDYADLDVEGKIVAIFGGAPEGFDTEQRAHFGSQSGKLDMAAAQGAIGMIGLSTSTSEKRFPWERVKGFATSKRMTWVHPNGRPDTPGKGLKASVSLNPAITEMLFDGSGKTFKEVRAAIDEDGASVPEGFALPVSVSIKGARVQEMGSSPNVVGLLSGADPILKDEYIVLTAHLDGLGISEKLLAEGKDAIRNGAVDNALGVASMLEAADRLVKDGAPARSILFIALTGEEKGLLGADYFAHYPTVAKSGLAANVNLDMPLAFHPFTDVVAFGAERSSLGPIVREATAKIGVTLSPDPVPEQGLFTRSDHYRFVEQGVPSVFLVVGFANGGQEQFNEFLAKHYHKPSDEVTLPILWDDVARFAEVNYLIATDLANVPERPSWNEGDFFGDLFAGDK
ncbi:MAG: aminopeptidase [Hyphococcus sp.]|nr:MAG: aminopeptidase [Marinicaulis sp.]